MSRLLMPAGSRPETLTAPHERRTSVTPPAPGAVVPVGDPATGSHCGPTESGTTSCASSADCGGKHPGQPSLTLAHVGPLSFRLSTGFSDATVLQDIARRAWPSA